eukprot:17782-Heterococcus_DN1.PRE.2
MVLRRARVLSITRAISSRTVARRRATLVHTWRQWCVYSTAQRHRRRTLKGNEPHCRSHVDQAPTEAVIHRYAHTMHDID